MCVVPLDRRAPGPPERHRNAQLAYRPGHSLGRSPLRLATVRVVGYVRVSTDRQVDAGAGLDVQRQAVRAWCREHGHRLVATVADEGVSGTLTDRPALAEALALLRERKAGAVVVHRLDRLARDLVLQEQLLAECWRMGADVCSTSAGEDAYLCDDPADPSRRLIRQILGAVSDYERAMVRLRLETGRRHKAAAGGYAYGAPPFGYRAEHGQLVARPDEQQALALIAELHRAQLVAGATSVREIAAALTAAGHRPRRGSYWHPGVVARIVARLPPATDASGPGKAGQPSSRPPSR